MKEGIVGGQCGCDKRKNKERSTLPSAERALHRSISKSVKIGPEMNEMGFKKSKESEHSETLKKHTMKGFAVSHLMK